MNHQSLAAFYVFAAVYLWPHTHTHKIYPLFGRDASGQNCILLKLKTWINIKEQPENYSANFHFFCLKKQCNCFRVFNDTTSPHSTDYSLMEHSTQHPYTYVQRTCRLAAVLSFVPCGSCSQAQYNSGALQLQKFSLFFSSSSMLCVCV